jgi:ketosteroid isomerase-like protein
MPNPDELIGLARDVIAAINSGEFDRAAEHAHPDIVLVRLAGQPELRGRDALRTWMEPDAFESLAYEPLEFEAAGNRVLVRSYVHGRGAGSGIEMETEAFAVWTFDEQLRVTRIQAFFPHEEDAARRAFKGD